MLKKSKKLISAWLAVIMVLTAIPFTAAAEDNDSSFSDAVEFTDDIYETGEVFVYEDNTPSVKKGGLTDVSPMATYSGLSLNYFDSGNQTLETYDAIDFYVMPTVTGNGRALLVSFVSGNSNYVAILCQLDVATGTVYSTNLQLSSSNTPAWFNLPAGDWCWVVLSANNTYTSATYRLIWNGYNPGGATGFEWYTANLVEAAFSYPNGVIRVNGSVYTPPPVAPTPQIIAQNFKASLPVSTPDGYGTPTYERVYATNNNPPATTDIVARLWATQDSLYYIAGTGTYSSSYVSGYSSPRTVVWVKLNTYLYSSPAHNMYMGHYFVYGTNGQVLAHEFFADGNADGFIILDATTGQVIDWISDYNIFNMLGWGTFSFSTTPNSGFYI